jgi:hypothetical protein
MKLAGRENPVGDKNSNSEREDMKHEKESSS